jgi:hypothetical protein
MQIDGWQVDCLIGVQPLELGNFCPSNSSALQMVGCCSVFEQANRAGSVGFQWVCTVQELEPPPVVETPFHPHNTCSESMLVDGLYFVTTLMAIQS